MPAGNYRQGDPWHGGILGTTARRGASAGSRSKSCSASVRRVAVAHIDPAKVAFAQVASSPLYSDDLFPMHFQL